MRIRASIGALGLLLLGAASPLRADEPMTWKLVVVAYGQDDFLVMDVTHPENGKATGKVVDAQAFLGKPEVKSLEIVDHAVKVTLASGGDSSTFQGRMSGPDRPVLGTFTFRGSLYPARFEQTQERKVATLSNGDLMRELNTVRRQTDAQARREKLHELLTKNAHEGSNYHIHNELLRAAVASEAPEAEVRKQVETWLADAQPYGAPWVAENQASALKALAGKKPYAMLAKELAVEADKALGDDAPLKQKAETARLLAEAAELAGDAELAKAAGERSALMETKLDEEYHHTVPPFKPETFAGRKETGANRVVLMELFTGAQCPPCVAADVAFDALMSSYKPSELIGLQYHLHIPGPDPLTNEDAEARAGYYKAQSTPTVLIDGEPLPQNTRGGGPMAASETKFGQYRPLVNERLEGQKRATIDLKASRDGDQIRITADAKADIKDQAEAKPRLRLALTEESIRYVGGNGLRFHHHVVRALPGGTEGLELKDGAGRQELAVSLKDVRESIGSYLKKYEQSTPFPNPLPKIQLDKLSVVAFVQDDADKQVWHAVSVPVEATR